MTTAVIVGGGPNGLAAAIRLAQHGVRVRVLEAKDTAGGGARSGSLTVPGLVHDECSAFHPGAVASPFLRSLGLERYGLRWRRPEVQLAHPLDSGSAGVLWQDVRRTARELGEDGVSWMRLFGRVARSFDDLVDGVFRPVPRWLRHPVALASFGCTALPPATWTVRRWRRPETRALFGGVAAHAFVSLRGPLSSATGLLLTGAAHAHGWPVAEGGTQSIIDAMAALLADLGGEIETGTPVGALDELGRPDLVLLSVAPDAAARIAGGRLPARIARAYRNHRYGPGAYKMDFAVRGGIPWTNESCRKAGTLHLGGTFEEIAEAEGQIVRGVMPDRPFVLVGQQYLADPSRSAGDVHPIWAYAHVPNGYQGDATEAITAQIERFAPGFRDRVVGRFVRPAAGMADYDANYVGGDISVGDNSGLRLLLRPRPSLDPYSTGIPGVYLCSSATPPGAGVHGMCGFNAAEAALAHLRMSRIPLVRGRWRAGETTPGS